MNANRIRVQNNICINIVGAIHESPLYLYVLPDGPTFECKSSKTKGGVPILPLQPPQNGLRGLAVPSKNPLRCCREFLKDDRFIVLFIL